MYYLFRIPLLSDAPLVPHVIDRYFGRAIYTITCVLSILRLPFHILPSILRLLAFLIFASQKGYVPFQRNNLNQEDYKAFRSHNLQAGIRTLGSIMNFIVIALGIIVFTSLPLPQLLRMICYGVILAEIAHLLPMKWQELFSSLWQYLPHKKIATKIMLNAKIHTFWRVWQKLLTRYCSYYSLSDEEKARYILATLQHYAILDSEMSARLAYMSSFRIVADNQYLTGGNVRDIARGEVFIYKSWTNDPWLLWALAVRRAPWIFDPRYLRRPFYYRSESYGIVTRFLLCHARFYVPYIIYQFGHCVKNAYYEPYYKTLRLLGIDFETMVGEDGNYSFVNPLIQLIEKWLGRYIVSHPAQRPLWSDNEVVLDVLQRLPTEGKISAFAIASQYMYPVKYIEEVLLAKIVTASHEHAIVEMHNEERVLSAQ